MPNAIQCERGVDLTAAADGKLMFKDLRSKPHRLLLIQDCELHGVTVVKTTWAKVKALLKGATGGNKGFEPTSEGLMQLLFDANVDINMDVDTEDD